MPASPVPPVESHALLVLLQLALLALALGRLAVRLRMPAVVGELFAGVLVGPSILQNLLPDVAGWLLPREVGQMHLLDAVAQLGVPYWSRSPVPSSSST